MQHAESMLRGSAAIHDGARTEISILESPIVTSPTSPTSLLVQFSPLTPVSEIVRTSSNPFTSQKSSQVASTSTASEIVPLFQMPSTRVNNALHTIPPQFPDKMFRGAAHFRRAVPRGLRSYKTTVVWLRVLECKVCDTILVYYFSFPCRISFILDFLILIPFTCFRIALDAPCPPPLDPRLFANGMSGGANGFHAQTRPNYHFRN
jgi:hypothetical protein